MGEEVDDKPASAHGVRKSGGTGPAIGLPPPPCPLPAHPQRVGELQQQLDRVHWRAAAREPQREVHGVRAAVAVGVELRDAHRRCGAAAAERRLERRRRRPHLLLPRLRALKDREAVAGVAHRWLLHVPRDLWPKAARRVGEQKRDDHGAGEHARAQQRRRRQQAAVVAPAQRFAVHLLEVEALVVVLWVQEGEGFEPAAVRVVPPCGARKPSRRSAAAAAAGKRRRVMCAPAPWSRLATLAPACAPRVWGWQRPCLVQVDRYFQALVGRSNSS